MKLMSHITRNQVVAFEDADMISQLSWHWKSTHHDLTLYLWNDGQVRLHLPPRTTFIKLGRIPAGWALALMDSPLDLRRGLARNMYRQQLDRKRMKLKFKR